MPDNLKVIAANFRQQLIADYLQAEVQDDKLLKWINELSESELLILLINNSDTQSTVEYAMYQIQEDVAYRAEMEGLPF